jgi:hypothetical protein
MRLLAGNPGIFEGYRYPLYQCMGYLIHTVLKSTRYTGKTAQKRLQMAFGFSK